MIGDAGLRIEEALRQQEQLFASLRQPDLPPVAVKEECIVILFEAANLFAERGLGLVQGLGRAGKAAMKGDRMKGAELTVSHV